MCGVGLNNLSLCYREREFQYVSVEVNDVMMCHDVWIGFTVNLVGGIPWYTYPSDLPLWKMMEFVSWDDDVPNRWKSKIMFQTTNQAWYNHRITYNPEQGFWTLLTWPNSVSVSVSFTCVNQAYMGIYPSTLKHNLMLQSDIWEDIPKHLINVMLMWHLLPGSSHTLPPWQHDLCAYGSRAAVLPVLKVALCQGINFLRPRPLSGDQLICEEDGRGVEVLPGLAGCHGQHGVPWGWPAGFNPELTRWLTLVNCILEYSGSEWLVKDGVPQGPKVSATGHERWQMWPWDHLGLALSGTCLLFPPMPQGQQAIVAP